MADYLAENLLAGFGKSLTSGNSRFRKSIPSERSARPLKTCWDCGGTWNKRSKKRLPDPPQRALRKAPERLLRKLPPHAMLPTLRQNRGRHPKLRQPKRNLPGRWILKTAWSRFEIGRASCRKECRSRWSPYH